MKCRHIMKRSVLSAGVALGLGAFGAASHAGSITLGDSGWRATWDSSLDAQVDIDFIDVIENSIFIQKAAQFRAPPQNGAFIPIVITFEQVGPSTVSSIVIDDEIVTNDTGQAWIGFRMDVGGSANPVYNLQMTAQSGGGGPIGFSIEPFTNGSFSNGNASLVITGGSLPNDEVWFPGGGGNDGQLWITVQSGTNGTLRSFTLSEQPLGTAPNPGDEGRTPGFWKQPHHFGHWPQPYCPSDGCPCGNATLFCDVFDCANACPAARSAYENKTLLEVLRQGGGKFKALGRHAVAALLNSEMDDGVLNYAFTAQEVIDMVNDAMATCRSQPAHGVLGDANEEGGGSLGGQSHCTDLDLDGAVGQTDLSVVLANWGRRGAGDIDGDGIVGMHDLQIILQNWGTY